MLTGEIPFITPRSLRLYLEERLDFPTDLLSSNAVSRNYLSFVKRLMDAKPENRLNAKEALLLSWLESERRRVGRPSTADSTTLTPTAPQTSTSSKPIMFWDPLPEPRRCTLGGDFGVVSFIAYAPNGKFIVSGSEDGRISTWDTTTGKLRYTKDIGGLYGIAISPRSKLVACATHRNMMIWDSTTGQEIQHESNNNDDAEYYCSGPCVFPPKGSPDHSPGIYITGKGKNIKLMDLADGKTCRGSVEAGMVAEHQSLSPLVISPNGEFAAACSYQNVYIWGIKGKNQKPRYILPVNKGFITAFSPDSNLLAIIGYREAMLWDLHNNIKIPVPGFRNGDSVAFSPDSKLVAFVDANRVRVLHTSGGGLYKDYGGPNSFRPYPVVAFSPSGNLIATASRDGIVKLWSSTDGTEQFAFKHPVDASSKGEDKSVQVAFSLDENDKILVSGWGKSIILWDYSG
jgi:WD40 repeat protein